MVQNYLKMDTYKSNDNLPVPMNNDSDTLERELILKQLLFLRQDINELKQLYMSKTDSSTLPSNKSLFVLPENKNLSADKNISNIDDGLLKGIKDDVIGEITMDELEKEVIERTLKIVKEIVEKQLKY